MAKTEVIYIRVTPELKERIRQAAEAEHRTLTNYLETLIIKALEEEPAHGNQR